MLSVVLPIAFAALTLSVLLAVWALVRARSVPERVLALDTLYIDAVAMLVLLGIYQTSTRTFEAALLIATLGFLSTVAFSRFVLRGDLIES